MPVPRRPLFGLGCVLILIAGVAVGISLWSRDREGTGEAVAHGSSPRRVEGVGEAQLAGRAPLPEPDAASPPEKGDGSASSAERPRLHGRLVFDPDDRPHEKRIYLLPKGSRGKRVFYEVKVRAAVEDDGTWGMRGDPRGHWIAGLASGYLPVFADGDVWAGEKVVLRPERGRRIEVFARVVAVDARPHLFVRVKAEDEAAHTYPGPGTQASIPTYRTFGRGVQTTVYASMTGKVRVQAGALGFVTQPTEIVLGPEENEATFVVTQGCKVEPRVHDARTGLPLSEEVYANTRPLDERHESSVYLALPAFAEYMDYGGVLPGAYYVAVQSEGYLPWRSERIDLERPGEKVVVEARLEPDPAFGRLLLEVTPPMGGTLQGAAFSVLLGRAGASGRTVWTAHPPRAVSADRRRILLAGLPAADVHLLAWTGPAAVGFIGDRTVHAGTTASIELALERGTFVRLLGVRQPHEGRIVGAVAPDLRSPEGVNLPFAWFWSRMPRQPGLRGWVTSSHDFRDEYVILREKANSDAVLGPYPFSDIRVLGTNAQLVPNER